MRIAKLQTAERTALGTIRPICGAGIKQRLPIPLAPMEIAPIAKNGESQATARMRTQPTLKSNCYAQTLHTSSLLLANSVATFDSGYVIGRLPARAAVGVAHPGCDTGIHGVRIRRLRQPWRRAFELHALERARTGNQRGRHLVVRRRARTGRERNGELPGQGAPCRITRVDPRAASASASRRFPPADPAPAARTPSASPPRPATPGSARA